MRDEEIGNKNWSDTVKAVDPAPTSLELNELGKRVNVVLDALQKDESVAIGWLVATQIANNYNNTLEPRGELEVVSNRPATWKAIAEGFTQDTFGKKVRSTMNPNDQLTNAELRQEYTEHSPVIDKAIGDVIGIIQTFIAERSQSHAPSVVFGGRGA